MTSTLQQEASRKFGMGAKAAMGTAQRLYEAGHITYMRTDGIDMAPEAVAEARDAITARYGAKYVPDTPRIYKNKAKNAQEAHECIRPTDMSKAAADLRLDGEQRKLYDLIWKRTLASQMEGARLERTTVTIRDRGGEVELRANGQVVVFDGFMKVYTEGRDDDAPTSDDDARLPAIHEGDAARKHANGLRPDYDKLTADAGDALLDDGALPANARLSPSGAVLGQQKLHPAPPRYTEATLVKKMEELGIGRPSTYASILGTIVDRGYVRKDGNRLFPEDQGRLVTAFLANYFRRYVGYDFTAGLEDELDQVSAGDADYKDVLARFWRDFKAAVDETAELRITDVLEKINEVLEPHLFPGDGSGADPRLCPKCEEGRLSMRTARWAGPSSAATAIPNAATPAPSARRHGGRGAGRRAHARRRARERRGGLAEVGPLGPYVQLGEATEENKKPKRSSLPKSWAPDAVDLDRGLQLLSLPRHIGTHPEDGADIESNLGRYGPYVKWNKVYAESARRGRDLHHRHEPRRRGAGREARLARSAREGGAAAQGAGRTPEGGGPVNVMEGRYGPYVKWEKVNATIPKEIAPADMTMEQAVELIAERVAKTGKKPAAKKKAAPTKAAAKKKAASKRPAAKKKTGVKTTN